MLLNSEHHWYKKSYTWLTLLLLPLSWLFGMAVVLRQFCYRNQLKKTVHFSVPVVVVGNITVGGTGKTPLVIWLVKFLKEQGFRPGIVSRGVGGMKQYLPHLVDTESDPQIVGDEAVLLAKQTHCPVVICIDRVAAVQELLRTTPCNIVIADDGLQHYRLGRTFEIAIVDGERQLGNGCLLPAGPLRELPARLQQVDCIVTHGSAGDVTMQLQGDELNAVHGDAKQALNQLTSKTVHAVAGIGNPSRFFTMLRSKGFQVIEHVFPDHHLYTAKDFNFADGDIIIMTEKDAVKCKHIADERFWYLPVQAKVDPKLQDLLLGKLGVVNQASVPLS
jgi:tetraacyldisaccharide 4'-kinase